MSTIDGDFYRMQADRYLRKAEAADRLAQLRTLPVGSVIMFARTNGNRSYDYVAILAGEPIPKWFISQGSRGPLDAMTTKDLISWLTDVVDGNIYVAQRFVPLAEYVSLVLTSGVADEVKKTEVVGGDVIRDAQVFINQMGQVRT